MIEVSAAQARRIALVSQGLHAVRPFGRGKEGALKALEQLGYAQIDTISVVARAHHHVLWSRVPDYRPDMLDALQAEGRVFEYWSHAAAFLPMCDHRYTLRRKDAAVERDPAWFPRAPKVMAAVLRRIRKEGPLMARDFKPEGPEGSGPWFDWKPAKIALERLFHEGQVMIRCRKGFQKVYDLTERVLPEGWSETRPSAAEQDEHFVLSCLRPHGLVTVKDCCHLWSKMQERCAVVLHRLQEQGLVQEARVEGCTEAHWIATEALDAATKRFPSRVRLLSPFDNAVIRRERLQRLFDFEYQIECYTPETKRRWGYFCLPMLFRDRFVGRADCKADRKGKTLIVRKLLLEEGEGKAWKTLVEPLVAELRAFAAFNGCETLRIEDCPHGHLARALEKALRGWDGSDPLESQAALASRGDAR